jgi:hypothetical protein
VRDAGGCGPSEHRITVRVEGSVAEMTVRVD